MELLIPILAIVCIFGLPITAVIVLIVRLTSSTNKERMEMIKRGMIPPEKVNHAPSRLRTLRAGMGSLGGGVGALLSVVLLELVSTENEGYQLLLALGTIFVCFGIAFTIYYVISQKEINADENNKE